MFVILSPSSRFPTLSFNPLPNDQFLDWSKLKAFADEKMNVTQKLNFVLESVENIEGT